MSASRMVRHSATSQWREVAAAEAPDVRHHSPFIGGGGGGGGTGWGWRGGGTATPIEMRWRAL